MDTNRTNEDVHVLECAECPRVSGATALRWKAYRLEDPDTCQVRIAFYCPECAKTERGKA